MPPIFLRPSQGSVEWMILLRPISQRVFCNPIEEDRGLSGAAAKVCLRGSAGWLGSKKLNGSKNCGRALLYFLT